MDKEDTVYTPTPTRWIGPYTEVAFKAAAATLGVLTAIACVQVTGSWMERVTGTSPDPSSDE